MDCIFCKIVSNQIPAKKVYEDEQVIALEDIAPVAPVHILIVPKKHLVNVLDLEPADHALVGHIHAVAAHIARERGIAENGFRIVTNTNAGAGQSVFHIHFHLLGGRSMTWPPG
jgi:histidine triad (HIT) family protein